MGAIKWLVPIAAALAYGALVGWAGPQVTAGGLLTFDMRPLGYSAADAQAFFTALTPEGRLAYLGPHRITDTIFVFLLTITLILPIWRFGRLWAFAALAYAAFDLAENEAVAGMVNRGAGRADQVWVASLFTQGKFVFLALAIGLALWGLWPRPGRRN